MRRSMNGAYNFSKLENLKMDSDISTYNTKQSKHADNTEASQ
jgi:hypothetical protein